MNTKRIDAKRKILRKIYGALSLTSALFVFQACYGMPHDRGWDSYIQGYVKSKATNQPIQGIKVSIDNQSAYTLTDSTGNFKIFATYATEYTLKFQDIDSTNNGSFMPKDTIIKSIDPSAFIYVSLDVK